MTDTEILAYLAGIIDGEGYIGIVKSKPYGNGKINYNYIATVQVRMASTPAVTLLKETLGGSLYKEKPHARNGNPLWVWQLANKKCESALYSLLPYLRVKKNVASHVLEYRKFAANNSKHRTKIVGYRNFPNSYGTVRVVPNLALSDEYILECEKYHISCKTLNKDSYS